jgi:hypothetical protein
MDFIPVDCTVDSPQKGVAERMNIALLEIVREMMSHATLPMLLLNCSLETKTYLLNLIPSKFIFKVPIKFWIGRKPSMRYIHIWGSPAHVLKGMTHKLE